MRVKKAATSLARWTLSNLLLFLYQRAQRGASSTAYQSTFKHWMF